MAQIDSRRSVLLAGQEVVNVDNVVGDARVVVHVPLRDRRGAARFEEQPVRDRRAPRRLEQPVRLEAVRRDVGLVRGRGAYRSAVAGALLVVGDVELVLRVHLIGDPAQHRVVPLAAAAVDILGPVRPRRPLHHLALGSRRRQEDVLRLVPVGVRPLP